MVRPFALTGGRAGTGRVELNMITLVKAVRPASGATTLTPESVTIVRMCQSRVLSVAEIAAELQVFLAVSKVLIADLIDEGYLICHKPQPIVNAPDIKILEAVLDGIRRL
ncbi:DUF742 domain-containing protein [Nocardia vinacea]|uniref:DUF742 domain-containing protein n=1 Tax=Nocardia vinacea TaxID=96468 RepID=A0ABZ1YTK3_9NOCA|nr:DUF742 domain-containing protein [Nocardia vinacea]